METETCEYCGQKIPEDERRDHEMGRDVRRLECPHQDLDQIAEEREPVRWSPGVLPDLW